MPKSNSDNASEDEAGFFHRIARALSSNWLSLFGSNLAALSVFAVVVFSALMTFGRLHHAYIGIVAFVLLPMAFVFGLLLIPLGLWRTRGRNRAGLEAGLLRFPIVDFNLKRTRNTAMLIFLVSVINVAFLGAVSYEGVKYTESNGFCGVVCHTPMEPQYTAFLDSPHRNLGCAECHIGEGAAGFVKAKTSGVTQLLMALTNSYPRPIVTDRDKMSSLNEACTHCHTATKDEGLKYVQSTKYLEDESNTPVYTAMFLDLGSTRSDSGIHGWHNQPGRTIEYVPGADDTSPMGAVRVSHPDGSSAIYTTGDSPGEDNWRAMTCVDCHNRVGHRFVPAGEAIDAAIRSGGIARSLPYVRSQSAAALSERLNAESVDRFDERLESFYREAYPDRADAFSADIENTARQLDSIAERNLFQEMNVSWKTYPDHRGHTESLGCFRCHDDTHATQNGQLIRQDCTICHNVLAWDEENPESLQQIGVISGENPTEIP